MSVVKFLYAAFGYIQTVIKFVAIARNKRTNEIRGSNFKGSGLGFIIAQSLVETHGGTLTVESEVGQGTVMKVFLPNGKADTT